MKAIDLAEHEDRIERWRKEAVPGAEEDEPVLRLLPCCLNLLQNLVKQSEFADRDSKDLQRCLGTLQLWAHEHGVHDGTLRSALEKSFDLRQAVLRLYVSLCKLLLRGVSSQFVSHAQADEAAIQYREALRTYQQTKWRVHDEGTSSDSDASCDGTNAIFEPIRSGLLVRKTRVYIECLVDLGSSLRSPAMDHLKEDVTADINLEQRSATDYHTDRLIAKFPLAKLDLLQCLGRASWERYQRMQQERELNTQRQSATTSDSKSQAVHSEFQDSGLGTSLPAGASSYAVTVVSLMSVTAGGKRAQIPPLSIEAKRGKKFDCSACGKSIRATNDREWRKHLYADLQPYTCFITGCAAVGKAFSTLQLWSAHLELEHSFGPEWETEPCSLCFATTQGGKTAILSHYAQHMEEIALSAIPPEIDSDSESDVNSVHTSELSMMGGLTEADAETLYRQMLARFHGSLYMNLVPIPDVGINLHKFRDLVETEGGFSQVTEQNLWAKIAPKVGFKGTLSEVKEIYTTWILPYEEHTKAVESHRLDEEEVLPDSSEARAQSVPDGNQGDLQALITSTSGDDRTQSITEWKFGLNPRKGESNEKDDRSSRFSRLESDTQTQHDDELIVTETESRHERGDPSIPDEEPANQSNDLLPTTAPDLIHSPAALETAKKTSTNLHAISKCVQCRKNRTKCIATHDWPTRCERCEKYNLVCSERTSSRRRAYSGPRAGRARESSTTAPRTSEEPFESSNWPGKIDRLSWDTTINSQPGGANSQEMSEGELARSMLTPIGTSYESQQSQFIEKSLSTHSRVIKEPLETYAASNLPLDIAVTDAPLVSSSLDDKPQEDHAKKMSTSTGSPFNERSLPLSEDPETLALDQSSSDSNQSPTTVPITSVPTDSFQGEVNEMHGRVSQYRQDLFPQDIWYCYSCGSWNMAYCDICPLCNTGTKF